MEPRAKRLLATWIGTVGCAPSVVTTTYTLAGPALLATFRLTYDRMGLLLAAGMLGYGAAALVAGVLLDLIAVAWLARGALLLAAIACLAGGVAPVWGLLGATMIIFGAAAAVLTVLPVVLFTDLYPGDRTRTMARWQLAISLATLPLPLIIGVLLARASGHFGDERGWRIMLLACVPLFLVFLASVPGRALGRRSGIEALRLDRVADVVRRPMFLPILAIGMLHTAADNSAYWWMILMIRERFQAGADLAGILAAAYGTAYATGRLLRGTVRWPWKPLPTIAVGSLLGAAILALATRAPTLPAVIAIYATAGIFLSLNWPSTLGYAGEQFPDRAGTVLGAVTAVTGPGTVLVSTLIGVVSRFAGGVAVGMLLPAGLFALLSIVAAGAHLRSRRLG